MYLTTSHIYFARNPCQTPRRYTTDITLVRCGIVVSTPDTKWPTVYSFSKGIKNG